ncbi:GNAT family acetyltransferase [Corynebacterium sp.]|uniref:GNAT family acetyltransferase n=1 Tax=Corynebacterium sp. TaxID=1720 RepID=UPI0026DF58B3|nr:GNAT family acetyltransferase [Corynebacterium sp.]MDO5512791.1 GNAT family acetyltransferase [Corynebacterium sp.]
MIISTLPEARIPEVVALWEAAHLTRPWNDPIADARKALETETSTVLIGTDGEEIVASAMVGFDGHRGWVYYVAVAPDRQGLHLGAEIMHAAEEWLRDRGVGKLQLMIREENHAVRSFYRALGYQTEQVTVMSLRL